jgi:hypothetical protein
MFPRFSSFAKLSTSNEDYTIERRTTRRSL